MKVKRQGNGFNFYSKSYESHADILIIEQKGRKLCEFQMRALLALRQEHSFKLHSFFY